MTSEFQNALEFAVEWLRHHGNGTTAGDVQPNEMIYYFGLGIGMTTDDHPMCKNKYLLSDDAVDYLVVTSQDDRAAFDLASRIIVTKLLRGEPLTTAAGVFAGMVVAGIYHAPPPQTQRGAKNFGPNLMIVVLAKIIAHEFNLPLTRNDEAKRKESVCDVIDQALRDFDRGRSVRAIKDLLVHKKYAHLRAVAEAIQDIIFTRLSQQIS